jgi:hypothetical protein
LKKSKVLDLLNRIATNGHRDLFMVELGVALLLTKFGIVGVAAKVLGSLLRGVVGVFMEEGIYVIDLSLDSLREGQKLKEFEVAAKAAYERATARVYDEAKKQAIRKQYLDIVSRIGTVGNGPK